MNFFGKKMIPFWAIFKEKENAFSAGISLYPPKKRDFDIIREPRQIGKSIWPKGILSHYSDKKTCFYLSCENIRDNRELASILDAIRGTKVILLDVGSGH